MKLFIPNDNQILVQKLSYTVVQVDDKTIGTKGQMTDVNGNEIPNSKGVYIFVISADFPNFSLSNFDKEVTGIFIKNNQPYFKTVGVPPYVNPPKKDCVFYVGSANNLANRLNSHWNLDKINNTTSLRLGFESRQWVKKFLKIYVIIPDLSKSSPAFNKNKLEKAIRNEYKSSFGK